MFLADDHGLESHRVQFPAACGVRKTGAILNTPRLAAGSFIAALQQQAIMLGGTVTYLDPEEAALADETNRRVISRPWDLWKAKYHG